MEIMDKGTHKNQLGNLEMPLSFQSANVSMPNNRNYALEFLHGLTCTFKHKPQMEKHNIEFMSKMLDKGHVVLVRERETSPGRVWYLPHFEVCHPKKMDQIRIVFDSYAEYQGKSPNRELLTGPDLLNTLLRVLVRFRRKDMAATCDVGEMLHLFHFSPEHRILRFLWFQEINLSKPIAEFQMTVRLFGNGPSPVVATYGLRKMVKHGEEADVKLFVERNFYVDDGLVSTPTAIEVITLVQTTWATLASANLRLHKVVSNSVSVMEALAVEDLAKDIHSLELWEMPYIGWWAAMEP